jgi:hypothetical protein
MCSNMCSQLVLLQHMVDMWDLDAGHFKVGDQILRVEIEDIYILTVVSHRGATMVLARGQWEASDLVDQNIV